MAHAAVDVVQFFQAKQTHAEGGEVGWLVTLQRHTGSRLQTQRQELLAVLQASIFGVAHYHAWRLETFGCHALDAAALEQGAHLAAQRDLFGAHLFKTVGTGFFHHIAQAGQRIGRHGGVVRMTTAFEGFHDLQPFFQVACKAGADGAVNGLAGALTEHHHGAGG